MLFVLYHVYRQFAVCVAQNGFVQAQSRREMPRLALITTSYYGNSLHLDAPGMKSLRVLLGIKPDKNTKMVKIR